MKKSNLITLLTFSVFIAAAILIMLSRKAPSGLGGEDIGENMVSAEAKPDEANPVKSVEIRGSETEAASKKASDSEKTTVVKEETPPGEHAAARGSRLFIGDSRTVGLWEYGGMDGADFFANEGMSVYNIHKKPVSVPGIGKVTLTELLDRRQYDKIYIMLGINELGYNLENTAVKYKEFAAFIKEKQPEAVLFLQANLHVAKRRSDRDRVINNGAINKINARIAELADNKNIFYLDANVLFDDGGGNLAAEKTEDETHLYGKYYAEWSEWICRQSALLAGEG